jgi:hypothetical protein
MNRFRDIVKEQFYAQMVDWISICHFIDRWNDQ